MSRASAKPLTEKQFLAMVKDLAHLRGWRPYHTHDSRRSAAGFPDLVLVRRGRLIFAELKVGKRQPTPAQVEWMNDLAGVYGDVAVYLWRETDWAEIQRALE